MCNHNPPLAYDLLSLERRLFSALGEFPYAYAGLRVVDDPKETENGTRLGPSRRWQDGTETGEMLEGTSVVTLPIDPAERDRARIRHALRLAASYVGRYVILVGADHTTGDLPEDEGEWVLRDPWVLGVLIDRQA